jgi:short-subunit dehydrogenase
MKAQYALITGASSGFGKDFAHILAKKGFNLIITARREDRLEQLKNEINKIS